MTQAQMLLALIVPATWGLGFTLAKVGMDQFPPLLIMSLRFGIAALVLVWFTKPPWGYMRDIFMVALIGATLQYGLTFNGLRGLDASTAVIVIQLEAPALALLGTLILKEKFGWSRAVGMVLAFGGVAVIAGEPRLEGNLGSVALVAAGATIWAVAQVMVSRLKAVPSMTLLAWVAVMAAPQMAIASFLIEDGQWEAIKGASIQDWSVVLYLALIMTALGYSVWYHLLTRCDVSSLSPFLLLTPVTSIIAGVVLLDERFTTAMVIGALMVLGGVVATTIVGRHSK
jgi:O-acetylserine/cysteine efflux transporter